MSIKPLPSLLPMWDAVEEYVSREPVWIPCSDEVLDLHHHPLTIRLRSHEEHGHLAVKGPDNGKCLVRLMRGDANDAFEHSFASLDVDPSAPRHDAQPVVFFLTARGAALVRKDEASTEDATLILDIHSIERPTGAPEPIPLAFQTQDPTGAVSVSSSARAGN